MLKSFDHAYRRLYEGWNYRLRGLAGGRWAARCRPTSIIFLLTERCNARCLHCDIWKNKGKEESPTTEQLKAVLTDLRRWLGPVYVAFSGGEALLVKHTPELIRHASKLGLYLEVLSHGYWNKPEVIETLAESGPSRITVSFDAASPTHSVVRGKEDFWDRTHNFVETLQEIRAKKKLKFQIRLKTVVMSHNITEVGGVAEYATKPGMHSFFQPIEQRYNTPEDDRWFEHDENWPQDTEQAVQAVENLIAMKRRGLHIDNSYSQLEAMIPYFRDPDASRVAMQSHSAHERKVQCSALTMLQFQSNGDVRICAGSDPIGNIKDRPIREIWENRPRWWEGGCCREQRCTDAERESQELVQLQ